MENQNLMLSLCTLTGMTLDEVVTEMMRVLPPEAYKEVPGAQKFTDILPAWLDEALTKCFGPIGVGWYFEQTVECLEPVSEKRKDGTTGRTLFPVQIKDFKLYYQYCDPSGTWVWSKPITSTGFNDNSDIGYSMKGASTNALGSAASKLLWQIGTYKNKIDHINAKQHTGVSKSLWVPEPTPKNGNGQVKTATVTVKTDAVQVEKAAVTNPETSGIVSEQVVVVPNTGGIPDNLVGQPLVTLDMNDPIVKNVVYWLAGKGSNNAGIVYAQGFDGFDGKVQGIAARMVSTAEKKKVN